MQRWLPTLTSIVILILIGLIQQRSRTAAGIIAVMPINIPLAMWVVYGGSGGNPVQMADFARSMLISMPPTFLFIVVAWIVLRWGWPFPAVIGAGYGAWGVTLGVTLLLRRLL